MHGSRGLTVLVCWRRCPVVLDTKLHSHSAPCCWWWRLVRYHFPFVSSFVVTADRQWQPARTREWKQRPGAKTFTKLSLRWQQTAVAGHWKWYATILCMLIISSMPEPWWSHPITAVPPVGFTKRTRQTHGSNVSSTWYIIGRLLARETSNFVHGRQMGMDFRVAGRKVQLTSTYGI